MTDFHSTPAPQVHDALFTTPVALMLDIRLTPLERNGWQVLRMLRAADGSSSLANVAQLRRYLTSTPLGQRAGYETAWRALIVLRLTGWISLMGQHRDPLSGHVLSQVYQVHESALTFHQACDRDASLPQLLQESIGHENNQVDRVAMHIRDDLAGVATASTDEAPVQRHDDDDPPSPTLSSSQQQQAAAQPSSFAGSAGGTTVPQQNSHACQASHRRDPTYKKYMYKEGTYRARESMREVAAPLPLPPCLARVAEDQRRDLQTALRRLPRQVCQEVLQELEARHKDGGVRNAVAYLFALIRRVGQGEFRLWAGRRQVSPTRQATPYVASAGAHASLGVPENALPAFRPVAPEVVRSHLDTIRAMLHMPVKVGDLAAELMQGGHWNASPA